MTREDLENMVIESTGRRDKTTLIRQALNFAIGEFSKERMWLDLQTEADATTSASLAYVALASDVHRVAQFRIIDGTQSTVIEIRDKSWLLAQCPDPASRSTGRPVYGYLEGGNLYMLPIPDDDYTIRYTYFRLHPALSQASSELLITHAGPSVVAFATHWVFQSLEKHEDANQWYLKYQQLLKSAKKVDTDNTAIRREMEARGSVPRLLNDYWLDPFVRSMP